MTKVYLQPGLRALSGGMGDWVYSIRNGKTIVGMRPLITKEPSEAQIAHQEQFKKAAAYAKRALKDEAMRPIYDLVSKQTGIPAFAVAVADFFNPPSIEFLDLANYNGKVGGIIQITTLDDVGVKNVEIVIKDEQMNPIESGNATESPKGSGNWSYETIIPVASGKHITVHAKAIDYPGGVAADYTSKTIL